MSSEAGIQSTATTHTGTEPLDQQVARDATSPKERATVQSLTLNLTNSTSFRLLPLQVVGPDNSGLPQMISPGDTSSCVMKTDSGNINVIEAMAICSIGGLGALVITATCGFEGRNQYQATVMGIPSLSSFVVSSDTNWPNNDLNPTLSLTLS